MLYPFSLTIDLYIRNGLEELKSLAEFGGEDFIVTDFWNFIDKSDDYEKDSDNR